MAGFIKPKIAGKQLPDGSFVLTPMDKKNLDDFIDYIWLKVFGNLNSSDIVDGGVTTRNIKVHSIISEHIGELVIGTSHIKDASITDAKIVELSASKITAGEIDASEVNIINLNVDNAMIGTLNGEKLLEGSVSGLKIEDGAIVNSKVGTRTLTGDRMVIGTITADELSAGSVTTQKLSANLIIGTDAKFTGTLEAATGTFKGLVGSTANIIKWVDPVNGNDANPGTQAQPRRTIMSVINEIPFQLNHEVGIWLCGGTYNETVTLSNISGWGSIYIRGASWGTAGASIVNKIVFSGIDPYISIDSVTFPSSTSNITLDMCRDVDIQSCIGQGGTYMVVVTKSYVIIGFCLANNYTGSVLLAQDNSRILSTGWQGAGSGNSYSKQVSTMCTVYKQGTQPGGLEYTSNGGQIIQI